MVDKGGNYGSYSSANSDGAFTLNRDNSADYAGTVYFQNTQNPNNFLGTLTINAGTLKFGAGTTNNVNAPIIINSGGTLDLTEGCLKTPGDSSMTVTVNTGGTLRVDNFKGGTGGSLGDLYGRTGKRTLNGGMIVVTGEGHNSDKGFTVNSDGGTFEYAKAGETLTFAVAAGNINNNTVAANGLLKIGGAGNISFSNSGTNVAMKISGSSDGTIEKFGDGTLTLSGSNTYAGTTTISGGTLKISNQNNVGGTSKIIFDGGVLAYNGSGQTFSKPFSATDNNEVIIDAQKGWFVLSDTGSFNNSTATIRVTNTTGEGGYLALNQVQTTTGFKGTFIASDGGELAVERNGSNVSHNLGADVTLQADPGGTVKITSTGINSGAGSKAMILNGGKLVLARVNNAVVSPTFAEGTEVRVDSTVNVLDGYAILRAGTPTQAIWGDGDLTVTSVKKNASGDDISGGGYLALNSTSGATTYTGTFIVKDYGLLTLEVADRLSNKGSIRVENTGKLEAWFSQTMKSLELDGGTLLLKNNGTTLTAPVAVSTDSTVETIADAKLNGNVTGSGNIEKKGGAKLTMQGNVALGGMNVTGGSVAFENTTDGTMPQKVKIDNLKSTANAVAFNVAGGKTTQFAGKITGNVAATGTGTLEMQGTVTGNLNIGDDMVFSPGDDGVGSTYVEGDFSLGVGSTLRIDVAANGSQDYLQFGGNLAYDSTSKIKVETDGVTPSSVFLMQGGFTSGMDVDELKTWLKTTGMLTINDQAPEWDYWEIIAVPVGSGHALFATEYSVPEPATWVMLLAGVAGIFLLRKRRR